MSPQEPIGVGPGSISLQLTRFQLRCSLSFAQGSTTRGTYSCQYYGDDGISVDDYAPYDRGTFALTEAPATH